MDADRANCRRMRLVHAALVVPALVAGVSVTLQGGTPTTTARLFQPAPAKRNAAPQALDCVAPDYAVYAKVLADSHMNGRRDTGRRDLVLRANTTGTRYDAPTMRRIMPEAHEETTAAYLAANHQPAVISACFDRQLRITVVDDDSLDAMFRSKKAGELFAGFYAGYPDATGVVTVSRVGFSLDGKEAIAYIRRQSGPHGGAGYMVLLRFERNGWKITAKKLVVMS